VRKLADQYLHDNIVANINHPSIIVWAIANELNAKVGTAQTSFIRHSVAVVRKLDKSRLIGQAFAGYPSSGCQKGYGPLTALGVNLYFGWYTGRLGEISDRTELSSYLDQVHRCYPHKAVFATEWGAEANRDGPSDEKGTYAFQAQWIADTLNVLDSKPWLAGATYFTLQEFRIRPDWDGSNPYPTTPLHQKAVIGYTGVKKPGYDVLAQMYKQHVQLGR
jgi:beta-glucuronidase